MNPIHSKNRLITVPYSKASRAWVMPIKHPGPYADAKALEQAHKARCTQDRHIAQAWADRAEKWVEARVYREVAA